MSKGLCEMSDAPRLSARRPALRLFSQIVCTAFALLASAPAFAQAIVKLRLGNTTASAVYWPGYVAQRQGFFREEGLIIEEYIVGNPTLVAQQVISNSLDIGVTTYETLIHATREKAPISGFAGMLRRYAYSFMVSSKIDRVQDLRGKRVMLPLPRQLLTQAFNNYLVANGMKVEDVDQVFDGSSSNRFAAMAAGVVQGAYLNAPFDLKAAEGGYKKLFDLGEFYPDAGSALVVARKDWLLKNPETARGFGRALKKATTWLYDPANRSAAVDVLVADTRVERAIVDKIYDYMVGQLKPYPLDARIPPESMQRIIDLLIQIGDLKPGPKPEDYIETAYYP